MTGGELFDRIVEKGSYSEKDAADLIKQDSFTSCRIEEKKLCSKSLEVQIHWNFEDISFRLKGLTCFDVSNSTLLFYARAFKKFDC